MKQSLLSFMMAMCLASVAMAAWSQNLVLEQEEADDAIAVVGYFCKKHHYVFMTTVWQQIGVWQNKNCLISCC